MENSEKLNPMAPFVEVIQERWWQGKTPPLPGHTIGKDLSIVKAWLRQGYDREELLGALALYEGAPATLRVTYSRGQHHILGLLVVEFQKKRAIGENKVGSILAKMASEGVL